jgi:hypothetical protein
MSMHADPVVRMLEALEHALRSAFADPSIDEISADDLLGDYPAVQYVSPEGAFYVDILTRLGEGSRFEDLETGGPGVRLLGRPGADRRLGLFGRVRRRHRRRRAVGRARGVAGCGSP